MLLGENRKCPYCEKVCLNRLQKLKHLRMAHPKECFANSSESDIFRCTKCDKKFFVKRACENHEFKVAFWHSESMFSAFFKLKLG